MTAYAPVRPPWITRWPGTLLWTVIAVGGSVVSAVLVSRGKWFELAALLLVIPAFLMVQRFPMLVVGVWFVVLPLMSGLEDGGSLKGAYWLIHRIAPVATLIIVVVSAMTKASHRRLFRLGLPEVIMFAYLVSSVLSIAYLSPAVGAEIRHLYDRVFIPMVLYALIRILRPGREELRRFMVLLVVLMASQAAFGLIQWIAPGMLPDRFLGRAGERTTGTLDHANVFGIVMLWAGTLALHISRTVSSRYSPLGIPMFVLGVGMAFLTFSRASWLAAVVIVMAMFVVYPVAAKRTVAAGLAVLIVFAMVGGTGFVGGYFQERFYSEASERSALSRLPVVFASVRMFEAKPLTGWGYGNFDTYDRQFQSSVSDLFVPEKDHSSHNLFLTIAAEQGTVGIVTYLGAAAYWLAKTPKALSRLRTNGLFGKRFLIALWAVLLGHVIVNNFSNMTVSFGLAVWWLSLAMIANLITDAESAPATSFEPVPT